jgi:hypothetical protein
MKLLIAYGLKLFIIFFALIFSGFLYFKGGEYIVSFLLPVWNPPAVTEFPNSLKVETNDCEIALPVSIEGKTYKFLLDTNRPFSLGALEKLNFKDKKFELIKGIFGFGLVKDLKIGKMEFHYVRLPLLGSKEVKGFKLNNIPEGYDGVLGNDFVFNVNMGIQLSKKRIIIRKPLERPKDRKFSEIRLKTDIIPLLPKAYLSFMGKEVHLQLNNMEKSSVLLEEKAHAKAIESALQEEELDPTIAVLGKETVEDISKKEVGFLESYTGPDGYLGCGLMKQFKEVGLDYKSGNLFVVR